MPVNKLYSVTIREDKQVIAKISFEGYIKRGRIGHKIDSEQVEISENYDTTTIIRLLWYFADLVEEFSEEADA